MTKYRESLREMHRELTEMGHKPDTELVHVRKEGPSTERETLFWRSCCDTEILPIQTDCNKINKIL